jgi:hypothetical protein
MTKSSLASSNAHTSQIKPASDKDIPYGYGYFFRALRDYRSGELSRTEVTLLEYFIGMSEYYLKKGHIRFWHSYNSIHKDTGIAVATIKSKVEKFKKLGFISVRLRSIAGVPTTTFTVHYLKIVKQSVTLFGPSKGQTKEHIQRVRQRRQALARMFLLRTRLDNAAWSSYNGKVNF